MCIDSPPQAAPERFYNANLAPEFSEDEGTIARQFKDLLDYARRSDDLDAFTSKLDIAPQKRRRDNSPATMFQRPAPIPLPNQLGGFRQQAPVPIYNTRASDKPITPGGDFYNFARGLSDEGVGAYSTKFIKDLRGAEDKSGLFEEYGVQDIVGQSRVLRGGGKANFGVDQSTALLPQTISETFTPGGTGADGVSGQPGKTNVQQKVYRAAINKNAVRNIA